MINYLVEIVSDVHLLVTLRLWQCFSKLFLFNCIVESYTNMTFKVLNKKVSERKCEVSFGEFQGRSLARRGSAGPVNTAVCWPPPTAVI